MIQVSSSHALRLLAVEFEHRGWRDDQDVALAIVQAILNSGGMFDDRYLKGVVSRTFLTVNRTTRSGVKDAVKRALADVRIVEGVSPSYAPVLLNIITDSISVRNERTMKKKIVINNQGQFAGNIDSPKAQTRVERQQQLRLSGSEEALLRQHWDDPEVQAALMMEAPAEVKSSRLAATLSKVAGFAEDVAANIAANVIAGRIGW